MKRMNEAKPACRLRVEDIEIPGSPWRDCELWDGTPMVREPSGGWASLISARVLGPLWRHVEATGLGWVTTSEQGFLLARDPDRMLACDGAYTSRERLPDPPRRGFWPCAPDFALEVRSPDDAWVAVLEKCGIWIAHGARVVWAVNPQGREVIVFRPAERPLEARGAAVVDGAPALPEFRLVVGDIMRDL